MDAAPEPELEAERAALRGALAHAFSEGASALWSESRFNDLALRVFRYQAAANPIYGAFLRNRSIDPEKIGDWQEIPPVPTRAFQELPLVCRSPAPPEAIFRTSGTTRGGTRRGEHRVRDLALYRASLLACGRTFLRPELEGGRDGIRPAGAGRGRASDGPGDASPGADLHPTPSRPPPLRLLALHPSPEERPDSSLATMLGTFLAEWDDGEGGFFAEGDWTLRGAAFEEAIRRGAEAGIPLLLAGTAFAFVHWLDGSEGRPLPPLPEGSRLLETGGFKGRSRVVPRAELYAALSTRLGLSTDRMVNEYGMTELLSQFYEPVLRAPPPASIEARRHAAPPWLRTQALDPSDLRPLPSGEVGLFAHLDLANLDSVAAVLTEDSGVVFPGEIHLHGRIAGAEPRGCSLSMEDLLIAHEGVR